MEAGALKAPPALLERIVLLLIPPPAREAVAGDMRETYSSPRQYGLAALNILPFVIVSQARRNANLPLLCLQGIFLFACLVSLAPEKSWIDAVFVTLLLLMVLVLRDAYLPHKRPAAKIAILEALTVSSLGTCYAFSTASPGVGYHAQHSGFFSLFTVAIVPFFMPVLGMLRAGLILYSEGRHPLPEGQIAFEGMARDYREFEQRTRRANRLEIAGLFLAMAAGTGLILQFDFPTAPIGWALLCLFALSAAWLLVRGPAPVPPPKADFAGLRTLYRRELARQNQVRRFMWWLWFSPALAFFVTMAGRGIAAGKPLLTVVSILPMVFTGFCIASLNRERGGWVSEKINALARMRERRTQLDCDVTAPLPR